jgi:hypothetical protein
VAGPLGLALDPDAAPDIEFAGEVLDEDGEPVESDGGVVVLREAARSPLFSHAVTNAVPRATEMARAIGVSLMLPPWLGIASASGLLYYSSTKASDNVSSNCRDPATAILQGRSPH